MTFCPIAYTDTYHIKHKYIEQFTGIRFEIDIIEIFDYLLTGISVLSEGM